MIPANFGGPGEFDLFALDPIRMRAMEVTEVENVAELAIEGLLGPAVASWDRRHFARASSGSVDERYMMIGPRVA